MVLGGSNGHNGENEWTPLDAPVVQMSGRNTVTLDITEATKFFRLI